MRWLLDTNVVSELWKDKPNAGAAAWIEENKDECAVSEITFAELYYGIHRLPFGKRRAELLRHAAFLREDYRDAILGFNAIEAEFWGEYAAEVTAARGKKYRTARTIRDAALAATARAWSLVAVTRDVAHFPFVETLNPFSA
jgi:predicted nucleic acid-binding protein